MSDVKGRAREALTSLGDEWQSTDGNVWAARIIAVPDPSDEAGQTPMPDWIQEKVCDTSKEFAPIIASLPSLISDLLSLVEEQENEIARLVSYPDDYYSTADVMKIRAEYEHEIERLRGLGL